VLLATGAYPSQSIKPDPKKSGATADVIFQPISGAQVKVAGVSILGNHIELRNMQTTWRVLPGADSVTFRNVTSDGAVYITGASNVSVLGGQVYSPVPVSSDSMIASANGKVPTNILIDGVSFHDFQDVGPGQYHHIECLQVGAAINLTIQNSSFSNCATHDIFIRSWGVTNNSSYPLSNIVIQNNTMAATTSGYYALHILDDLWTSAPRTSFSILGNTAAQMILVRVSNGTAQVRGNFLPSMSAFFCHSYGQNQWFDYNTYGTGVPCGPHDKVTNSASPSPTPVPVPPSSTPPKGPRAHAGVRALIHS
jgi:hypothetical protein